MLYVHTLWYHDYDDYGVFFYYEIDDFGFINRQIEIFNDFSFGLADKNFQYNTFMSYDKIDIDDIYQVIECDDEAKSFTISETQFNAVWDYFMNKKLNNISS